MTLCTRSSSGKNQKGPQGKGRGTGELGDKCLHRGCSGEILKNLDVTVQRQARTGLRSEGNRVCS